MSTFQDRIPRLLALAFWSAASTLMSGCFQANMQWADLSGTQSLILGPRSKLVFTLAPGSSIASAAPFATQPVVTALDATGQVLSDFSSQVALAAFNDAQCTVPYAQTLSVTATANAGIASFTGVGFTRAGTVYLQASSPGIQPACSGSVRIDAGAPVSLTFDQQPSSTAAVSGAFPQSPVVGVYDAFGNVVSGWAGTISLSADTDGACTASATGTLAATANPVTPASGSAAFSGVSYSQIETIYLKASASGLTSACSSAVSVASGLADPAHSSISVSPGTLAADGTSAATVTITLRDSSGAAVTGVVPQFASTGTSNTIVQPASATNGSGVATGTILSTHAELKTLSISSPAGFSTDTAIVHFVPGPANTAQSLIAASPSSIPAGSVSTLTLKTKDANGNPLTTGGLAVAFTFSGGGSTGSLSAVTDNGDGTYTASLTGTTAGTASLVQATIGGVSVTSSPASVTVSPGGVSFAQSSVSVSTGTVTSGNTSTLILTAKDAAGNQLTTGGLAVSFTLSGGASLGTISSVVDNGNGTYTATFTGTIAGSPSSVNATIGGSSVTSSLPTVTVVPGPANKLAFVTQPAGSVAACSAFSVQPVVAVQDINGNTVTASAASVTLGPFGDAACSTPAPGTINSGVTAASGGVASFVVANFNQGATLHLRATSPGLTSACSTGVVTVATPTKSISISAGGSQVGAPYSPLAIPLGITVMDNCGAVIANEPVTWTLSSGSAGNLSLSSANSDSSGKVNNAWYFGTTPGTYAAQASIAGGSTVTFNGTSIQGAWTAASTGNAPSARYAAASVWTKSKLVVWGGYDGTTYRNDGGIFDPVANSWTAGGTSPTNAPSPRAYTAAVWTGAKMIVWGGYSGTTYLSDGGIFDPLTNTWTAGGTVATGTPSARGFHSAVWTGARMIVWGGQDSSGYRNDGAAYDPTGGAWSPVTTTNAPTPRVSHVALWNGRYMVIWGGYNGSALNTGALYDPSTGLWSPIPVAGAPTARRDSTAVWNGSRVLIWGGNDGGGIYPSDGGSFDPTVNTWTPIASGLINEPTGRSGAAGFWTGSAFLIWGGYNGTTYPNDMGFYDPASGKWGYGPPAQTNEPPGRTQAAAAWTGGTLLVWGGYNGSALGNGGIYDPQPVSINAWQPMATTAAPATRDSFMAVWTGSKMLVWGGKNQSLTNLNTGALYDPIANTWSPTTTTNAPVARSFGTVVWTQSKAVVWGGLGSGPVNSGGIYDPIGDIWVPGGTATAGAPTSRIQHSAVWTGSKMIVWGGQNAGVPLSDGGIFDPAAGGSNGLWSAITTTNGPTARANHTAVWSGAKMIVWGGQNAASSLNDGGVYDPATDAWKPGGTNTGGAPSGRVGHAAVWTGVKMVVWGGCVGVLTNDSLCSGAGVNHSFNTGALYDPSLDSWSPMSASNNPGEIAFTHSAWTGTNLVVWGGFDNFHQTYLGGGGVFNPSTNSWTLLPSLEAGELQARQGGTMIWIGNRLLIWGGYDNINSQEYADGAVLDPAGTNPWKSVSVASAPSPRSAHTAVWTGSKMIIWGGTDTGATRFGDGGIYDPMSDSWTPIPAASVNEPSGRYLHSAVWTGSRMIVCGGWNGSSSDTACGTFEPESGSWSPTASMPAGRDSHTAIWTGSLLLVWGGQTTGTSVNSGYAFNPSTNSWTALATTSQPTARFLHTAVWTGSKMIVWGGGATAATAVNSGGILDLTAGLPGTWSPITTTGVPLARSQHAAVWSGSKMIVFGGINTGGSALNTGATFDPVSSVWSPLPAVPKDQSFDASPMNYWGAPTAVWTGSRMIIWGGDQLGFSAHGVSRGIIFNPDVPSWTKTGFGYTGYPVDTGGGGRQGHTMIWTGSSAIVWGGCTNGTGGGSSCVGGGAQNDGGIFTPFYTP